MPRRNLNATRKRLARGRQRDAIRLAGRDNGLATRCATGKAGFPEHEARRRLAAYQVRTNANGKATPRRVYECPICATWHLTSQLRDRVTPRGAPSRTVGRSH